MYQVRRQSIQAIKRFSTQGRRGFSTANSAPQQKSMVAAGGAFAGVVAMLVLGSGSAAVQEPARVVTIVEEVHEPETFKVVIQDESCRGDLEKLMCRVDALETAVLEFKAAKHNKAFVFVKPHAVTDKVCELVKGGLEEAGIKIVEEGVIEHGDIDSKKLIDNHYGAIASKAVLLDPSELVVPDAGKASFEKMFGESWESAIKGEKVYNAAQACEILGIDGNELEKKWRLLKAGTDLIKFGGGFYCGKVGDMYIMNGFYMSMRQKFTEAPAKIHYYSVEWNPNKLAWADFRGVVLGSTDPSKAADGSLRKKIFDNWESLGLDAKPNTGDNGVHASASPFEAMAERMIWLGKDINDEDIAKVMFKRGVEEAKLREWLKDAQVTHGSGSGSIFDLLEDLDTDDVLDELKSVA